MPNFRAIYNGSLSGLLTWEAVEAVLAEMRARPDGWWIYDTREDLPRVPVPASELPSRLDDMMAFLRRHHRADYCGFVYVDDKSAPRLVKVYDPRNASSCSLGAPIPVYTISAMPPEALPFDETAGTDDVAAVPRSFLQRIPKGGS